MATIQEINSSIILGDFTNEQLNSIVTAVQFARNQLSRKTKASLMLGDNVKFYSSKTGRDYTGEVIKIARKYVTVRSPGNGLWRVPANMLTVV